METAIFFIERIHQHQKVQLVKTDLIALIPARVGSVRLPGKNVALCGGKPMAEWTIIAAIQAKIFDKIVVSTNDDRVRRLAQHYTLPVLYQPDFEQDASASIRVVRHVLEHHNASYMMLLQPTSPLRRASHIIEAWKQFQRAFPDDSLVSVNPDDEVNGAIYLFTTNRIKRMGSLYDASSWRYMMDRKASIDVDTQADLDAANMIFANDPG